MENRTGWIVAALNEIVGVLKDVWVEFENSGPCCGIRLDREARSCPESMPTPGSCCGVRV